MSAGERVDATAMCLTCGTTRRARGEVNPLGLRLCRDVLRCKTCRASTPHAAADRGPRYGWHEDGSRTLCDETTRLVAELVAMPGVDLRWRDDCFCLAHGPMLFSLEWASGHPGETMPCICADAPPVRHGAQPAGWIAPNSSGGWVVELDSRHGRESLAEPLRELRRDLLAGEATQGYLLPAYNVGPEIFDIGEAQARARAATRSASKRSGEET